MNEDECQKFRELQAGSVFVFNTNIVHSSSYNISPFDRRTLHISYASAESLPNSASKNDKEFLKNQDYQPVKPLSKEVTARLLATRKVS